MNAPDPTDVARPPGRRRHFAQPPAGRYATFRDRLRATGAVVLLTLWVLSALDVIAAWLGLDSPLEPLA